MSRQDGSQEVDNAGVQPFTQMKTISSLLGPIFKELGIEERLTIDEIRGEWRTIFNEPLSLHTYPVELTSGELLINVDSPVWLQQLKFFKQDIIKKLARYNIKTIRFKHGKVYVRDEKERENQRELPLPPKSLGPSDISWIEEITSGLEDSEVRESVRKAIRKQLQKPKPKDK